jgi:hypothetical protein
MRTSVRQDGDGDWIVRLVDFSGQGVDLTCLDEKHARVLEDELRLCTWLDEITDGDLANSEEES